MARHRTVRRSLFVSVCAFLAGAACKTAPADDALLDAGGATVTGLVDATSLSRASEDARVFATTRPPCDDAASCLRLAKLYETGDTVERSDGRASTLYGRACDLGSAEACERVAARHDRDTATDTERAAVARLYERACDGGRAGA